MRKPHGFSRGDIDGGVAGVGPGFIPFDSDTQDGLDSLNQFTEEVRLASTSEGPLTWQTGAFYFHTDYVDTTVGPTGFPPSTSVRQKNDSWAIFGQGSYAFTDQFSVTAGLRYTSDDKDLIVASAPANNTSVSDEKVSWDLSAMYKFTPAVSVYARVADGFRGPSIQGRNIAFGAPPSVAQSETNLSFEAGWKTELLNDTLRFNGAVFQYTVDHIQFTAVGGAGNLVQLINADKGKAYGFETDVEYVPIPNLVLTGGFSYNHTKIDDRGPSGRHLRTVHDHRPDRDVGRRHVRQYRWQPVPQRARDDSRPDRPLQHSHGRRRRTVRLHRLVLPGQDQHLPLPVGRVSHRPPVRGRPEAGLCARPMAAGRPPCSSATSRTKTTSRARSTSTTTRRSSTIRA